MKRYTMIRSCTRTQPQWEEIENGTFIAPEGWHVISISPFLDAAERVALWITFESDDPVPNDQPYR